MKMGLAVTWDNPDIQVHEPDPGAPDGVGAVVPSPLLKAGHDYKIRVRVWNGSYDAPAVGLPVHHSLLSFGAGTTSHAIATTKVDLGVKGSPHQPAFAVVDWTTPAAAGHYCLQARLEWLDDANPENNLGQENVNVGELKSPAEFTFTLRNDASVRHRYVLEADTYQLPVLRPCKERTRFKTRIEESRARWADANEEQSYGAFPVPPDWSVIIDPSELLLPAGDEREIRVSIEPKGPFTGAKSFNVHAFILRDDGRRDLAGGITLTVTKA
jgi:hypothetical protein